IVRSTSLPRDTSSLLILEGLPAAPSRNSHRPTIRSRAGIPSGPDPAIPPHPPASRQVERVLGRSKALTAHRSCPPQLNRNVSLRKQRARRAYAPPASVRPADQTIFH